MTQRVARPIKFAAFISIIVSVAVMFVACQGAVGPQGPPGEDGDDGTAGTPGTPGTPGADGKSPLYAKAGGAAIAVYVNNGETVDSAGDPETITLIDHYDGGIGDVTVGSLTPADTVAAIAAAGRIFTHDLTDGVATFAVQLTDAEPPVPVVSNDEYILQMYTVEITDTAGPSLTLTLSVRRNQPPSAPNVAPVTIGTSSAMLDEARAVGTTLSCNPQNKCTLTLDGMDEDTSDELTYTPTTESDALTVSNDDDGNIVLQGVKSTDDNDATTTDDTAEVKIVLTDLGGLTSETTVAVTVDGAPTGDSPPALTLKHKSGAYEDAISDLTAFLSDPEGAEVTFSVKTQDTASLRVASAVVDDANDSLDITTNAEGSTTITIVATEDGGLTQAGEVSLSVTVTP